MRWLEEGCLELLDQTALPLFVTYIKCYDHNSVGDAIKRLAVRGAPAIGAAAAYGLALGAKRLDCTDKNQFMLKVGRIAEELAATRPTAVNLQWALSRMTDTLLSSGETAPSAIKSLLLAEAHKIYQQDIDANRLIGHYGQKLIPQDARILTHCNAGALATAGYGTALGVVTAAWEAGKNISVYADETRPLLQGARLTTWEMLQLGIPVTLITDNMAGYLMAQKKVDLVIVGADRITANGDTANKIGTYGLAVMAHYHHLPFYVAAPMSTIDTSLSTGKEIPIEERGQSEVTFLAGQQIAPEGVNVWNPAFDVTPHELVTAIVTEKGILYPEYSKSILGAVKSN
ncbi:MAG: S-methyl-5-thioribose-1-phosphate isomerase [Peptococcaceae bacterium]|nr:S-methyl-5-thioribose-1-phosphate isomerase [Peptococcaceae bacterium]